MRTRYIIRNKLEHIHEQEHKIVLIDSTRENGFNCTPKYYFNTMDYIELIFMHHAFRSNQRGSIQAVDKLHRGEANITT